MRLCEVLADATPRQRWVTNGCVHAYGMHMHIRYMAPLVQVCVRSGNLVDVEEVAAFPNIFGCICAFLVPQRRVLLHSRSKWLGAKGAKNWDCPYEPVFL